MVPDIFLKFFSLFIPVTSAKGKLKSQMKHLAREISHNKFAKFYKPKNREITVEFAKFMYDIYKVVAPVQVHLQNAAKSNVFKQVIAESFLDKNTESLRELLDGGPEVWAKIGDISTIVKTVTEKLEDFSAAFDSELIKEINNSYNNSLSMIRLITFDYYGIIKKFDSRIREFDFSSVPKFVNVTGSALTDKIKDFLEIASAAVTFSDWEHIVKIVKEYRNEQITLGNVQWNKTIDKLYSVYRSEILEKMIRHIDENPLWQFKPAIPNEHIAKDYLENKQKEVKTKLEKMVNYHKRSQKESMIDKLFGKADMNRTQYYTAKKNESYTKKNLTGFTHTEAINCLMAFLTDIFGTDIQELCDLLIVRGVWFSRESCMEMSESYHQILELLETIIAFDSKLSDSGNYGTRLKSTVISAARNNTQAKLANSIFANVNVEAMELINTGVNLLVVILNSFKSLLADFHNPTHTIIRNWQEIDNHNIPIAERLKTAAEKVDDFTMLMFLITGNEIVVQPPEEDSFD